MTCRLCPTLERHAQAAIDRALASGNFDHLTERNRASHMEHIRKVWIKLGITFGLRNFVCCVHLERGLLNTRNRYYRSLFQALTGVTLPSSNRGTKAAVIGYLGEVWAEYQAAKEAVRRWVEEEARTISIRQEAERRAALEPHERAMEDFAATMTPMERGRFMKSMAVLYRVEGRTETRGRHIFDLVRQGWRPDEACGKAGLTDADRYRWRLHGELTKAGARFARWLVASS